MDMQNLTAKLKKLNQLGYILQPTKLQLTLNEPASSKNGYRLKIDNEPECIALIHFNEKDEASLADLLINNGSDHEVEFQRNLPHYQDAHQIMLDIFDNIIKRH